MPDLKDAVIKRETYAVDLLGLTIQTTINPYTIRMSDVVEGDLAEQLAAMRLEWDLTDGGEPVATDAESIRKLTPGFLGAFFDALLVAAIPKATATPPSA